MAQDPQSIFKEDLWFFAHGDNSNAFLMNADGQQIDNLLNLSRASISSPSFQGDIRDGASSPNKPLKVIKNGHIAWYNAGVTQKGFFTLPAPGWEMLNQAEVWIVQQREGPLATANNQGFDSHFFAVDTAYPHHSDQATIHDGFGSTTKKTFDGSAVPFTDLHVYHVSSMNGLWQAFYNGGNLLHEDTNSVAQFGHTGLNFGFSTFEQTFTGWRYAIIAIKRISKRGERRRMNIWLEKAFPSLSLTNY